MYSTSAPSPVQLDVGRRQRRSRRRRRAGRPAAQLGVENDERASEAVEKGDRVSWILEERSTGVISEINRFGVEIKWLDGLTTRPFFNDMKMIRPIDS